MVTALSVCSWFCRETAGIHLNKRHPKRGDTSFPKSQWDVICKYVWFYPSPWCL